MIATAALIEFAPLEARAQSLDDFLARTLVDNPTIGAARAAARVARADIAIARADSLPSLDLTGNGQSLQGAGRSLNGQLPSTVDTQMSGNLSFELPLYRGGSVRNAVAAARARHRAAEIDYDRIVGDTLTAAAQAFAATARDEIIVDLHRENVRILDDERIQVLSEAGHGVATRTDIAQSEARLAGARASLARAEAQLVTSTEELARISGRRPVRPLELSGLKPPADAAAVVDADVEQAPAVIADGERVRAASYDVEVARAARRPQLSATATLDYVRFGGIDPVLRQLGSLDQYAGLRTAGGLTLRIPIFEGGATTARVRRARYIQQQSRARQNDTARRSLEQERDRHAELTADRGRIDLLAAAVAENRDAVRGVRIDRRLGIRSTLDVLNAEEELFSSRRDLAQARFDAFSDAVALLNSVGRAQTVLTPKSAADGPAGSSIPTAVAAMPQPPAHQRTGGGTLARAQVVHRGNTHRPTSMMIACDFDLGRLPYSRTVPAAARGRHLDYDPSILHMAARGARLRYDMSATGRS